MSVLQAPNGSVYNIPDAPNARAEYVKMLLDTLYTPFVQPSVMNSLANNNFIAASDPLSGAQQSSLLGLEVVSQSPEQIDQVSQRVSNSLGGDKVDWVAFFTGLWNTGKQSNVLGTAEDQKKIEGQVFGAVGSVVADTVSQKIARFIRDNFLLVAGGSVAVVLFIVYSLGKRR